MSKIATPTSACHRIHSQGPSEKEARGCSLLSCAFEKVAGRSVGGFKLHGVHIYNSSDYLSLSTHRSPPCPIPHGLAGQANLFILYREQPNGRGCEHVCRDRIVSSPANKESKRSMCKANDRVVTRQGRVGRPAIWRWTLQGCNGQQLKGKRGHY